MSETFDRAAISLEVNDLGERGWRCLACYREGKPSYYGDFDGPEEAEAFAAEHLRTAHGLAEAKPAGPAPDASPPAA